MDERLTDAGTPSSGESNEANGRAMAALQKQQERESEEAAAGDQFRRDLEELLRDHLNTCMALASCSSTHEAHMGSSHSSSSHVGSSRVLSRASSFNSTHDMGNEGVGGGHLSHHLCHRSPTPVLRHEDGGQSYRHFSAEETTQRESGMVENNSNATSGSRSGRSQSLLARWAAHHAQEIFTTMEHEAREAELLALARLHTVSMLDSSFLTEPPPPPPSRTTDTSPPPPSVERPPHRRASSLVQMWREFEEERRRAELESRMAESLSVRNLSRDNDILTESQSQLQQGTLDQDEDSAIDNHANAEINREPVPMEVSVERPRRRASPLIQMWRAIEEERREFEEERRRVELESRMAENLSARNLSRDDDIIMESQSQTLDRSEDSTINHTSAEINSELLQTEAPVERPRRRPSSLVQMWRAIEEERRRAELENRMAIRLSSTGGGITRDISESGSELNSSSAELQQESGNEVESDNLEASLIESADAAHHPDLTPHREEEDAHHPDLIPHREEEEELNSQALNATNIVVADEAVSLMVEGERERVREIIQRLTSEGGVVQDSQPPNESHSDNRSAWLGEDERERVRGLAREWVRVSSNQRNGEDGRASLERHSPQSGGAVRRHVREREGASSPESRERIISRDTQRLLDRQSILDLLMRIERERQRELEGLTEHHAVTEFAHRNRLQLVLRGRFLRNGMPNEEERLPSIAAGELGQLRERRPVTGMREGFRHRLERIMRGQANDRSLESQANAQIEVNRNGENQEGVGGTNFAEAREALTAQMSRDWRGFTRVTDLQSLEEATAYNMELQELLGRRSVTTALGSEFRDRLDQLVRSFIQSQGTTPTTAWDFLRAGRNADTLPQQQGVQPQQEEAQSEPERIADGSEDAASVVLSPRAPPPPPLPLWPPPPPPPPPRRMPHWQPELQHTAWSRPLQRHSYMELDAINELRSENGKMQQKVSDLQRMMETCLEMQLELQRSIRQEVSGALQQMYDGKDVPNEVTDGSKWTSVKKGICCVCCDKNIDSLLYRCGHMCTCLNCASELIRSSGKCPMCRAPIVEVVRAFTLV